MAPVIACAAFTNGMTRERSRAEGLSAIRASRPDLPTVNSPALLSESRVATQSRPQYARGSSWTRANKAVCFSDPWRDTSNDSIAGITGTHLGSLPVTLQEVCVSAPLASVALRRGLSGLFVDFDRLPELLATTGATGGRRDRSLARRRTDAAGSPEERCSPIGPSCMCRRRECRCLLR